MLSRSQCGRLAVSDDRESGVGACWSSMSGRSRSRTDRNCRRWQPPHQDRRRSAAPVGPLLLPRQRLRSTIGQAGYGQRHRNVQPVEVPPANVPFVTRFVTSAPAVSIRAVRQAVRTDVGQFILNHPVSSPGQDRSSVRRTLQVVAASATRRRRESALKDRRRPVPYRLRHTAWAWSRPLRSGRSGLG